MSPQSGPGGHSRRAALRMGALAAVASPLVASCEGGYATGPDPLLPLLRAARADAEAARQLTAGTSGEAARLARAVVRVRDKQAQVLHAEIERLNRPKPEGESGGRGPRVESVGALVERIAGAHEQASSLVSSLPPHRAGLVGAVAAGCTGLRQLDPEPEAGSGGHRPAPPVSADKLSSTAVTGLRKALAAEYAAIWIYGLVTAFLPGAFSSAITEARDAHRANREAAREALTAAGVRPPPAEPAYVPAKPVTDKQSAMRVVVTAEADAAEAWHGVLVRTENTALRKLAEVNLCGSAARATRWRAESGTRPAAPALPGKP